MTDTFLTEALLEEKKREQINDKSHDNTKVKFNASITSVSPRDDEKYLKYERVFNQVDSKNNPEDYYSSFPVKPAVGFWKALATGKYGLENLGVNIPDTFLNFDTTYWLYRDDDTGKIVKITEAVYTEFEQALEKKYSYVNDFLEHKLADIPGNRPEIPFCIARGTTGIDHLAAKFVFSLRSLKETRKYNIDSQTLMQNFLIPKGFQACIFRLVYHTSNCKTNKGNYAYRIKNRLNIFDPHPKKSLVNKTTINTEQANSFYITLVTGGSLKDFEAQAERVVLFLERSYNLRISKIVLDFLTDFEGTNWLVNMKAAEMEIVNPINIGLEEGDGKVALDKLTCSVYCKLCGLIFKRDDARKTLTYKLLWELLQHLKKRGIYLKGIAVSHNSTRQCRVCDLCYMLVVSEHELIDIEQKFARAQNIPIAEDYVRVPVDQRPKHRPALLNEKLYQWRLLFNFTQIIDFEPGNDSVDVKNTYLQYKFFNHKSSFRFKRAKDETKPHTLDTSLAGTDGKNGGISFYDTKFQKKKKPIVTGTYAINSIRVHYFFSETPDIGNFLEKTNMEIRVTKGNDWNDIIAEGTTSTIQFFKKKYQGGQKHQIRILCFFEDGKYCTVKGLVGLVCDGIINTETMNLYRHNGIYLPDEGFYNSNPFPIEWLEMFEKGDVLMEEYIEEKLDEKPKEQAYSPKCSRRDMEKMIDPIESRPKTNYSTVESRIPKRSMSANKLTTQSRFGSQGNSYREKIALGESENFRFSLLTENAQKNLRPMTTTSKSRPDITRPVSGFPTTTNAEREAQKAKAQEKSEEEKDLIDKEIELLSYLTSKNGKKQDKKPSSGKVSEKIKNIEAELRAIDDDELINKYLNEDKNGDNQLIDKYFGSGEPEDSSQNKRNVAPAEKKESDNPKTVESDRMSGQAGQVISHYEFANFLEEQKKKMSGHERKYPVETQ